MNCKDDATMLNEAIDYFFDIKEKLFYSYEPEIEAKISYDNGDIAKFHIEVFMEMCKRIKNTYQILSETEEKDKILLVIKICNELTKIAFNRETRGGVELYCISILAMLSLLAFQDIDAVKSNSNKLIGLSIGLIWVDFYNDTPEDVYKRIKNFLLTDYRHHLYRDCAELNFNIFQSQYFRI